jgi:hypothetical protein
MATELASQETTLDPAMVETILVEGNLKALTPTQRLKYYEAVCKSVGLNPLTKPFAYIELNGKLQLYALKETTDQLRFMHRISVHLVKTDMIGDSYLVTACATMPDGRTDESTGAVWVKGLAGDNHSNALMKAETKAKRRVTLSIAGLGMLDDSEADSIRGAETGVVDLETGELMDAPKAAPKAAPASKPRAAPPTAPIAPEPQVVVVPPEVVTCEGSIPESPEDAAPEAPASNRPGPQEEPPPFCLEHRVPYELRNSMKNPDETRWVHDTESGYCVKPFD